ncbi:hypothetical protein F5890DRAFT_1461113 [Lentinula detonsa]|uniref:CAP-Gly domain-containing protein n=1 Tax=Lentinula detonsa TaxID=2804962 RepID=A0AA38Q0E1_9AGAR|nr:hypothetical protein F5890DRAFT_1461113 [Lentinula detonsa]
MNSLPFVGDRVSYSGHLGTVKFVGNVENTTGIWLGIEWDDPDRGKHDGVKDGKRYFSCRIPNAGSFIRPSVQVIRGVSFLQALKAKYVEDLYGSTSQEKVTLGSSNGAIEVEAVNLDKIRNKLANLGRIREVSLENEFVSRVDEPGSIRETCPNVHGLDLSASLLSTWNVVADIAIELPVLQRLALKFVFSLMSSIQHFTPLPSRNRFAEVPLDTLKITNSFQSLTDLQLNGSLMSWRQIQHVTSFMPKLVSVELGSNQLCELEYDDIPNPHSSIRNINLEGNKCKDWTCICRSLCTYKHLDRVILTSNEIDSIPPLTDVSFVLKELKHISLSSNNINSWNDLDALPIWCPSLTSLSVIGNPLVESGDEVRYSRPFIIARIPTLEILDSTAVSARERTDSELLYLSYISRRFSESNISITQLMREHPRWKELSNKHGTTLSVSESVTHQDRLSSKLIEVQVQQMFAPTPSEIREWTIPTSIRVLPTMSLKVFELKIRKTFNIEKDSRCSLWLKMSDGSWVELTDVAHDLDWLGLESGSQVVCCVTVR